jgi:S1-C subfamily serine protease
MLDRVRRRTEKEIEVPRAVLDAVFRRTDLLARHAMVCDKEPGGYCTPVRIFGMRADTALGRLGFENGDKILGVDGAKVASLAEIRAAYERSRAKKDVRVEFERRGVTAATTFFELP